MVKRLGGNLKNESDFIFDEEAIIRACRQAQKRESDVYGIRFNVIYDRRGEFIESFNVYDRETDSNYKVEYHKEEYHGHKWHIWCK